MSQVANVTISSGKCNSLEWRMYPISSECTVLSGESIPWVAKLTVSSGEMNSLGWQNEQSRVAK